jgi:hypothetical protein
VFLSVSPQKYMIIFKLQIFFSFFFRATASSAIQMVAKWRTGVVIGKNTLHFGSAESENDD